jgi:hypothetical protein
MDKQIKDILVKVIKELHNDLHEESRRLVWTRAELFDLLRDHASDVAFDSALREYESAMVDYDKIASALKALENMYDEKSYKVAFTDGTSLESTNYGAINTIALECDLPVTFLVGGKEYAQI